MLKSALSFLALALCSFSVMAQEESSQHWHMVQVSPKNMMAADVHGSVDADAGVRRTIVALYFSAPQRSDDNQPIDFIVFEEEFDCTTPGRYRMIEGDGYIANLTKPVDSARPENPQWQTVSQKADGFLVWKAVCLEPMEGTALHGFSVHEDVLAHYRRIAHTLE